MKHVRFGIAGALMVTLMCAVLTGAQKKAATRRSQPCSSRLATLYATDPLTQTISLTTGLEGHVFESHEVSNRQSDLGYGNYFPEALTVGVEGGREGTIVDLGAWPDVSARYGYQETVGGGQGYASIHFQNGVLVILANRDRQTFQPLQEANELFAAPKALASRPAALGHIYLIRITDRNEPSFELIGKLLVVSHQPSDHVTIRWDLLRR